MDHSLDLGQFLKSETHIKEVFPKFKNLIPPFLTLDLNMEWVELEHIFKDSEVILMHSTS